LLSVPSLIGMVRAVYEAQRYGSHREVIVGGEV